MPYVKNLETATDQPWVLLGELKVTKGVVEVRTGSEERYQRTCRE